MEAIILKFVGMLISGLKWAAGSFVGRAMAGVGVVWVNFYAVMPEVKAFLAERFNVLPANALNFLGALRVDDAMIVVVSAVVARVGMKMLTTTVASIEHLIASEPGA